MNRQTEIEMAKARSELDGVWRDDKREKKNPLLFDFPHQGLPVYAMMKFLAGMPQDAELSNVGFNISTNSTSMLFTSKEFPETEQGKRILILYPNLKMENGLCWIEMPEIPKNKI